MGADIVVSLTFSPHTTCGLIRSSYPEAQKTHQHRLKAYLPERIARALHTSPDLVQRAVEGFYVRDPSQLRVRSLLRLASSS